jgi:hypothetical protein
MANVNKAEIIRTANQTNSLGGYINTDGKWCATRTPDELATLINSLGFVVISAKVTHNCTTQVIAADIVGELRGVYVMSWNGFVRQYNPEIHGDTAI